MGNKYFSAEQFQNDIAIEISPVQMNQIIVLADNNQTAFFSRYDLLGCKGHINAQLVELQLFTDIKISIPEAAPPMLDKADGEYINTIKVNDYLWKTSRMELELYTRSRTGKWVLRGIVPIKSNSGFRYRRSRLIDLFTDNVQSEFGKGGAIGAKLVNVGFGDLKSPDLVNIAGSWIQEPIIVQEQLPYVVNTVNVAGSSSSPSPSPSPSPTPVETINEFQLTLNGQTVILEAREKRTSLTITVVNAGASGGTVFTYDSLGNVNNSSFIDFYSNESGRVITDLNTWKGKVGANQSGFGDPGDEITLKLTEKYTL